MKRTTYSQTIPLLLSAALAACVFLSAGPACLAQDSIATTDFFHDGVSARAFGMGGAFTGIADDVSAIYWNPAGLYQLDSTQFFTTRSTRSEFDLTTQTVSLATPYNRGMAGFSLVYSTLGNLIISSIDPVTDRLTPSGVEGEDDIAFAGSYAWPYSEEISFGATVKYARQKVVYYSASGWGFDLGAMYQYDENSRVGVSLQNVGDMDIGTDQVPFNIRIGASTRALDKNLLVSASYDSDFLGEQMYGLGAEYLLAENFAARIGTMDGEFTAGLGISYENLSLDYAFHGDDETGDIQKLSVGYRIPTKRKKPFPAAKPQEQPPAPTPVMKEDLKEKKPAKEEAPEEKKERTRPARSKEKDEEKKEEKPPEKPKVEKKEEPLKELKKTSTISGRTLPAVKTPPADESVLPPILESLPSYKETEPGTIDLSFPVPKDETPVIDDTISYPYTLPPEAPPPQAYDYWPVVPSETGEQLFGLDPE